MKGFTLVELLVAVGIIGILAAVSLVSINSVRAKGRDARRLQDMKELSKALDTYAISNAGAELKNCVNGAKVSECGAPDAAPPLPIAINKISDPSGSKDACSNASLQACEYSAQRELGSQKSDDYEFCFYFETAYTGTGLTGPHRIEPGGSIRASCGN